MQTVDMPEIMTIEQATLRLRMLATYLETLPGDRLLEVPVGGDTFFGLDPHGAARLVRLLAPAHGGPQ